MKTKSESEEAVILANKVLDDASRDPDSDLSILARQFLRALREKDRLKGWMEKYATHARWDTDDLSGFDCLWLGEEHGYVPAERALRGENPE